MREGLGPLLVDRVTCAGNDLDAPVGHRRGQPACRAHVAVVELSRHEGAWKSHMRKLLPQWVHDSRAHSSERAGETGDVVGHPLRASLCDEAWATALQAGEKRQAAPVIDKSFESVSLDPFRQRLIASPSPLPRVIIQSGMGADGKQGGDALGLRGGDMKGKPPAHRVACDVGLFNTQLVPQGLEISSAGVHAARRPWVRARLAVSAQVGHDPLIAVWHSGDDLEPAPSVLCEAVQQGDRRALPGHEVAQSDVLTLENHGDSMLWM